MIVILFSYIVGIDYRHKHFVVYIVFKNIGNNSDLIKQNLVTYIIHYGLIIVLFDWSQKFNT